MKVCTKCGVEKPLSEFYPYRKKLGKGGYFDGLQYQCKACSKAAALSWHRANPQSARAKYLRMACGMTDAEFSKMYSDQAGKCGICGEVMRPRGKSHASAVVDHDHAMGTIRMLVHSACNMAIGFFQDDPKKIRGALDYLCRHGKV